VQALQQAMRWSACPVAGGVDPLQRRPWWRRQRQRLVVSARARARQGRRPPFQVSQLGPLVGVRVPPRTQLLDAHADRAERAWCCFHAWPAPRHHWWSKWAIQRSALCPSSSMAGRGDHAGSAGADAQPVEAVAQHRVRVLEPS
jgi:hypothetical protein